MLTQKNCVTVLVTLHRSEKYSERFYCIWKVSRNFKNLKIWDLQGFLSHFNDEIFAYFKKIKQIMENKYKGKGKNIKNTLPVQQTASVQQDSSTKNVQFEKMSKNYMHENLPNNAGWGIFLKWR